MGRFEWVTPESLATGQGHLLGVSASWWVCNDEGKVLVFYPAGSTSPVAQASANKTITERLSARPMYRNEGATGVVFIEQAYLPDSPSNYY